MPIKFNISQKLLQLIFWLLLKTTIKATCMLYSVNFDTLYPTQFRNRGEIESYKSPPVVYIYIWKNMQNALYMRMLQVMINNNSLLQENKLK